jgi:hypothetical protein
LLQLRFTCRELAVFSPVLMRHHESSASFPENKLVQSVTYDDRAKRRLVKLTDDNGRKFKEICIP